MTELLSILKDFNQYGVMALMIVLFIYFVRFSKKQYVEIDDEGQPITMKSLSNQMKVIRTNHLHGLPEMAESLHRIEEGQKSTNEKLEKLNENMSYIRGRLNGHDK